MAVGDRIGIADKETLDLTKQNTDNILNKVNSGVGGTDWGKYTTLIYSEIRPSDNKTILEITGAGVLKSVSSTYDTNSSYGLSKSAIKITADGTVVSLPTECSVTLNYLFTRNLKIETQSSTIKTVAISYGLKI
ncbi:hypothetical protein ACTQ4P_20670 [Clostridium sporogenes]|uniref:hypothetical protein n=1 Tax=Clostridium sporogenes TaxID=1509 RepID=UPI0028FFF057|nr:hypothetical protein [Clostridium botulinum]